MYTFDNAVSVHVCARSEAEWERWASIFGRLFVNFTRTNAIGGWVGDKIIETEPVAIVTTWGVDWGKVRRILRYAQWYQAVARQEAVALQLTIDGKWTSYVVFAGDWQELTCTLRKVFDTEYREECETLALCNYFDEVARRYDAAETSDGCDYSDHH